MGQPYKNLISKQLHVIKYFPRLKRLLGNHENTHILRVCGMHRGGKGHKVTGFIDSMVSRDTVCAFNVQSKRPVDTQTDIQTPTRMRKFTIIHVHTLTVATCPYEHAK